MKNSVHANGGFIGRVADYASEDYYTTQGNGYNLNNATYDNISFTIGTYTTADIYFKPDGTTFFVSDINGTIRKYSMATPWDLSSSSYANSSLSATSAFGLYFKTDGTRLYYINNSIDKIIQVDLSTAWDLSTAGTEVQGAPAVGNIVRGVRFSSDGTKMYSSDRSNTQIEQFNLSTAWDISSSSASSTPSQTFNVGSQGTQPAIYAFNPDGTKMWVTDSSNDSIYEYSLSTAWSVSSASYSSISFDLSSEMTTPIGGQFKPDGNKMYIAGSTNNKVYQYSVSTSINGNKKNSGVWSMDAHYLNTEVAPQGYRYIKWHITDIKSMSASMTQISELYLKYNGSNISWGSATITNPGGNNPSREQPSKLIDGDETTKVLDFNVDQGGGSIFIIDAGVGNLFNFDSYYYVTGNDTAARDPISWTMEGSNDGTNYTVLHTVTNATITGDRRASTQTFTL